MTERDADAAAARGHGGGGGARLVHPTLLALLVLAVFLPGLRNGSTSFDDGPLVFDNPVLARFGWTDLRDTLDPTAPRGDSLGRQYLPLDTLSYALDRALFGVRPEPYHLQAIAYHLAATLALYGLVGRLGGAPASALLTAAIFAVHPVQVEAVTWISGRRTALAGALMLLSAVAWARHVETSSRRAQAGSLALAVAANLAKQSAVALLPILLALEWGIRRARDASGAALPPWSAARRALAYAPLLVVTLAFAAIGVLVGRREGAMAPFPFGLDERARFVLAGLWGYARLLAWPTGLTPLRHTAIPDSWGAPPVLLGALVALGGAVLLVALVRAGRALPAAGLAIAAAAMLPAIHGGASSLVAERYLYLTVGGAAIALADLARGLSLRLRSPGFVHALSAALVLSLALASALRVRAWRDDLSLYGAAVAVDPEGAFARLQYGSALARAGRLPEAEGALRRAAALAAAPTVRPSGDLPRALLALGVVLEAEGNRDEAALSFEAALSSARERGVAVEEAALAREEFLRRSRALPPSPGTGGPR